ncbi:uncharacterized protein LOC122062306 [Macadamia integrifolia]|uniref:uncharacterized protein LOC122062306 n=1 Tax=Macadamia integrifolia TaxID=60698 RepID=UPI001C4FF654|nr:uncharacterized protein LOC122062306 [Macadamia integrifolia]
MEEQGEEWRVVEKSPSQGSKVRFIFEKGWWLGKKIAITGVALSSAPFVIPPLVVFSILGVVFAVPFGFVFATYACTEKIMSKLFPMPAYFSPSLLGCMTYYEDEECDYVEGGIYREDEEDEEYLEGTLDDEAQIAAEEIGGQQQGGLGWGKEKPIKGGDKSLGDFQEKEKAMLDKEQTMKERGGEGTMDNLEEKETLLRTSMVIEQNRDGINENNASEAEEKLVKEIKVARMGERKDDREVEVIEQEVKQITETKGVVVGRDVDIVDISISVEEVKQTQHSQNLDKIGNEGRPTGVVMDESRGKTAEKRDKKHANKRDKLVGEFFKGRRAEKRVEENVYNNKELQEMEKMAKVSRVEEDALNIAVVGKPTKDMKVSMLEESTEEVLNNVEEGGKSKRKSYVENMKEISDKNGFYMVDEKNAFQEKSNIGDKILETLANPVSSDTAEFNAAKGASRKETIIPSNEVLGEEKIWEQIDAMRTIVGYKATPHATCLEELKALYLFTGVEPPASFKESSDLIEVNYKLRFLMSKVGVK